MRQVLRANHFTITCNQAFESVIEACKTVPRQGQQGTWITSQIQDAYTQLHTIGLAYSFEAWQNNALVGGFYGVKMGGVFFGESMFSRVSNASKAAFITAVQQWLMPQVALIDCQVHTPHLESLGGRFISRPQFLALLDAHIGQPTLG